MQRGDHLVKGFYKAALEPTFEFCIDKITAERSVILLESIKLIVLYKLGWYRQVLVPFGMKAFFAFF
jgi:hypothetical protein